jgi:hypothetical protein
MMSSYVRSPARLTPPGRADCSRIAQGPGTHARLRCDAVISLPAASLRFSPKRHSFGGPGPWSGHLPFACDVMAATWPALVVELGAFYGESYFGLCQAAQEHAVPCSLYAIDTWAGDEQGGYYGEEIYSDVRAYNQENYSSCSQLIRASFDEALPSFSGESVDLLHIDGHHSYESARHDFDAWLPKVRPGGIVMLHDTSVRSPGFGVWRLWEELRRLFTETFTFSQSAGLGVLRKPGPAASAGFLAGLFAATPAEASAISDFYVCAARRLRLEWENAVLQRAGSSPLFCPVQVFYALGEDYAAEHCATAAIELGKWERVTLELPAGAGNKPLRIDPSDRPCVIEISAIRIRSSGRSTVLWEWCTGQPLPFQEAGTAYLLDVDGAVLAVSDGPDPQILLEGVCGPAYEQPIELDMRLRVTPCVPVELPPALIRESGSARPQAGGRLPERVFPSVVPLRHSDILDRRTGMEAIETRLRQMQADLEELRRASLRGLLNRIFRAGPKRPETR